MLASAIASLFDDRAEHELLLDAATPALDLLARVNSARPLVEYQRDPVRFAVEKLGMPEHTLRWSMNPGYENHVWDGTPDPIVAMADALANYEDVGAESGTGLGKSHALGWLSLWFLASWGGARVFSYAAKEDQLDLYAWNEIRKLWPRFRRLFPMARLYKSLRIRMDGAEDEGELAGWGADGRTVGVGAGEEIATKAAGMHAPDMLILGEEVPGWELAVTLALENTCTDVHNLRFYVGNPDHQHDPLHQHCISPGVRHVRLSALDHPNVVCNNVRDPKWEDLENDVPVVPGAISRKSIQRRALKYGVESRIYRSRVRGISPEEAEEALIKAVWVREAFQRYLDEQKRRELWEQGYEARGVDVAQSDGGDLAAIARGHGAVLYECVAFPVGEGHPTRDSSVLGRNVATEVALKGINPRHVGVDPVGVGAGTVNKLRELSLQVPSLNGGETPWPALDENLLREKGIGLREEELYWNLRAQMHWQMREDLQHGRLAIAPDEELLRDLTTPTWRTRNGKILVESKEDIRTRLKRSPNKGDAAIYWNFVRWRRAMPEEEQQPSAWDPEVLRHEAREGRRVRETPPVRPANINPTILEYVE